MNPPSAPPPPPSSPAASTTAQPTDGWLIGIVLAVLTFWLFAQTLLNVIPTVQQDLGIAVTIANFAVTVTALFAGVFIVVLGGLGDRFGHTLVFRAGVLASVLGSGLLVLTPPDAGTLTVTMLLLGRIVQGLSIAAIMPSALALIDHFYVGAERQRAVSFFSVGTFGGLGLASLVGGVVAAAVGWRSIFVVSIVAALAALVLTRRTPPVRPRGEPRERHRFDWTGLLTFLVAMVGLNVYVSQGARLGWTSPTGLGIVAVTIIAFVAFVTVDGRKGPAAFVDLGMFRNPRFTGPVLANFLMNATAAVIITTLSLVQRGAGWSSLQAGLLTIGHLLAVLTTIRFGERLLQRFGPKRPMLWGAILDACGVLLATLTFLPTPAYVVVVVLGLALFGAGQGIFATPAIDATITSVPASEVGTASGILKMGSTLGQAIGVTLSTTLVAVGASVEVSGDLFAGWSPAAAPLRFGTMLGTGLLVVIAVVMIAAIVRTVPRGDSERPAQT